MLGAVLAAMALVAAGGPSATIGTNHVALDDRGARLSVGFDGAARLLRRPAPPPVEPGGGPQRSPDGRWVATGSAGVVDVAPAGRPTQRTRVERSRFGLIFWAPDSRHLAYLRRLPGSLELVVAAPTGGARVLVRRACEGAVSWSPDGRRIAVVVPRPHVGCGARRVVDLDVVGLDGDARRVARGVRGQPTWAPKGALILLSGGPLEVVNADSLVRRTLIPTRSDGWWSPDGRWIAAVSGSLSTLSVVRPDGSHVRVLGDHARAGLDPTFSPDGRHLAATASGGLVLADLDRPRQTSVPVDGFVRFDAPRWSHGRLTLNARAYEPGD